MDDITREQIPREDPHYILNDDEYIHPAEPQNHQVPTNNSTTSTTINSYYPPEEHGFRNAGSEERLKRARSRYITVEAPLIIVSLTISILTTLRPEYLRERIAKDVYHYNQSANYSHCGANKSHIEDEIQSMTSTWLLYLGAIQSIPGLFMAIFLGSMSDRMGRKPTLALCITGYIVNVAGNILVISLHLPIEFFIIGDLIAGLSGGLSLLLATGAAYVTDITSKEMRTFRIVLVEMSLFIGLGIGQITLGFSVQYSNDHSLTKYVLPLWIALGCVAAALIYVLIPGVLIETVDKQTAGGRATQVSKVFTGIYHLVKVNADGRRVKLLCYTSVMMFAVYVIQSIAQISVVYSLGEPFCLNPLQVSIISTISLVSSSVGMVVGAALLPRWISHNWILQISLLNGMVTCLITALAQSTTLLFVAASLGLTKSLCFPVIRSQLSKVSAKHERGLMLAFIGCMDGLAAFLTPLISNSVYARTVFFFPPFVFYFLAGVLIIPCIIIGMLQYYLWAKTSYVPLDNSNIN